MEKNMDRRRFLRFSGTCALAALVASGCDLIRRERNAETIQTCPYGLSNDPYPGQCGNYIDTNNSGYCDYSETSLVQNSQVDPTSTPAAAQPTPTPSSKETGGAQELVIMGHHNCRYPGRCNRFRDNDNSGICDMSEGVDPNDL
jgi:hypothetical protein